MAGIEKVCECPKNKDGSCEYHGHLMYEYKRNSLQINPECREQFKGLSAFAVIVNMNNSNSDFISLRRKGIKYCKFNRADARKIYKYYGYYFDEYDTGICKVSLRDKAIKEYYLYPSKITINPYIMVYVKEHDRAYVNWCDSAKDIRAFKRNMRKLFGYNIPVYKNLKFKQKMQSYEIANKMIEDIKNENNYSNN